ncbi:MAG: protein of unknown function UPF0150 [uncultured bacterium]|nr:MAG: protein of unknown function UPF0150 [uncultured bacterium]HBD05355.1 hypothetical protein [Candidatus Uhrbacteria bacterium]
MPQNTVYQYSVFYQADADGGFTAFVPLLPGCHTEGDTLEEAEKNVSEAIGVYLESLRAFGEEIPVEKKVLHGIVAVPAAI